MLAVVKSLFSTSNFDQVAIDQIVELAGVSEKTFLNYQANMSQILHEFLLVRLRTIDLWSNDKVAELQVQKIEPQQTILWTARVSKNNYHPR